VVHIEGTSVTKIQEMTDASILATLGDRVKRERLNENVTQAELARRAGVDRIVLSRIENGKGATLRTLVRILRALKKLDHLDSFLPDPGISPLQLAEREGHKRLEASGKRGRPPGRKS
jgi:transcriptional regulator with XRE-family HTH domain